MPVADGTHRGPRGGRALLAALAAGALLAGCGTTEPAATGGGPTAAPGAPAPSTPPAQTETGEPVALRVPALGVDSDLLHLGLRPDGGAQTPADFDLAGWYENGGRPGGPGPTVVLGHVDSVAGPAVFARLDELASGDVVEVDTDGGATASYTVSRVERHPKDAFPTFEVFGATSEDVIRLVTCTGDFDPDERSYTDNLIVFAERVDSADRADSADPADPVDGD